MTVIAIMVIPARTYVDQLVDVTLSGSAKSVTVRDNKGAPLTPGGSASKASLVTKGRSVMDTVQIYPTNLSSLSMVSSDTIFDSAKEWTTIRAAAISVRNTAA